VEDWAEVHRLFHREGRPKAAIARQLEMSRNTVERLLGRSERPCCGSSPGARPQGSSPRPRATACSGDPRDADPFAALGPRSPDQLTVGAVVGRRTGSRRRHHVTWLRPVPLDASNAKASPDEDVSQRQLFAVLGESDGPRFTMR